MKQVNSNPTSNKTLTLSTYTFTGTGASGAVNASVDMSALERGQSVFLGLTGDSANGFTKNGEYFVIPVSSGAIKLATNKTNALLGVPDYTASGDAGSGVLYPNYGIGGVIFVGSSGNVNIRGIEVKTTGTSSFSLHKNIPDASILPFMIKDVSASGTTASDIVIWNR